MYTANEILRQNKLEEMRVAEALVNMKKAQEQALINQWRKEVMPLLLWEQEIIEQEEDWAYAHTLHGGERLVGRKLC